MPKLDRPLFGEWATGTLARALAFRHVANPEEPPGDPIIYLGEVAKLPGSHCPPSAAQALQRGRYSDAARAWLALSGEEKSQYNTSKPASFTGFNFFLHLTLGINLFYLGYCVFGSSWFQLSAVPGQPAAADYDALFPAAVDEFPTMVDGAHSPQAWVINRIYSAVGSLENFFIDHRESIEGG